MQDKKDMVSIVILVHNASGYAKHTLLSLRKTETRIPYEVIVLDNASNQRTQHMLVKLKQKGYIDKLLLSDENTLFSKGNNIAVREASDQSQYILLLNSDIEIRNKKWLDAMMRIHQTGSKGGGITALGCSSLNDNRPDGFCFLVDKALYTKHYLNEKYAWFYSLARLSADVINTEGCQVNTIRHYDNLLYHYGGKSGRIRNASGMDTDESEVTGWFRGKKCNLWDGIEVDERDICYNPYSVFNIKAKCRVLIKPYRKKLKKWIIKHFKKN